MNYNVIELHGIACDVKAQRIEGSVTNYPDLVVVGVTVNVALSNSHPHFTTSVLRGGKRGDTEKQRRCRQNSAEKKRPISHVLPLSMG